MNHPLFLDIKSQSTEELEKKSTEILKRMQRLRSWGQTGHEMWDQLQLMLDTINSEKQERLMTLDTTTNNVDNVVVNTDPLPDDADFDKKQKPKPKQYTLL